MDELIIPSYPWGYYGFFLVFVLVFLPCFFLSLLFIYLFSAAVFRVFVGGGFDGLECIL